MCFNWSYVIYYLIAFVVYTTWLLYGCVYNYVMIVNIYIIYSTLLFVFIGHGYRYWKWKMLHACVLNIKNLVYHSCSHMCEMVPILLRELDCHLCNIPFQPGQPLPNGRILVHYRSPFEVGYIRIFWIELGSMLA